MSDSESDVSVVDEDKSPFDRNDVIEMNDGIYTLIDLGPRDNMLAETILDAMSSGSRYPEIYPRLNGLLRIYLCLGYILQPQILNIQWLLDNSLERNERNPFLKDILKRIMKREPLGIITARNINQSQKQVLQKAYIKLIKRVPILNKLYLDNVSQITSEVLIPSDDPGFYDKGVNELVGSFLFKGRKSTRKSGRRKSGKKSPKRKSRSPNKGRKPRKSK
jgi:hypothetical protein